MGASFLSILSQIGQSLSNFRACQFIEKSRRSQLRRVGMALGGCGFCCRLAALFGFGQDLLDPRRVLVNVLDIIVVDLYHGVFILDRGNDNKHSLLSYAVSFSIPDSRMKNVSQRETHFDGERQNPHSFVVRIVRFTVFQRRGSDGGGAGRSVGKVSCLPPCSWRDV